MQTNNHFLLCMSLLHHFQHFLQCHRRTVIHFASFFFIGQQLRINQRSRINNHICLLQQIFSSDGDQIRCTASCSYKINHLYDPPPDFYLLSFPYYNCVFRSFIRFSNNRSTCVVRPSSPIALEYSTAPMISCPCARWFR